MIDPNYRDDFYYLYSVVQFSKTDRTCHPSDFLPDRLKNDWIDPYFRLQGENYIKITENNFKITPFGKEYLCLLRQMIELELEFIEFKSETYHLMN